MDKKTLSWLEDSDPVIRFRLHRDLLKSDPKIIQSIQNEIEKTGWGAAFLSHQNLDGHWGLAYYLPKFTSTHYTLLMLRMIWFPNTNLIILNTVEMVLDQNIAQDGGLGHRIGYPTSDVCIVGMFLNVACYFKATEDKLKTLIDFFIKVQLKDGGFNCQYKKKHTHHSSVHTTLSVAEGLWEYERNGYTYKLDEVKRMRHEANEFILMHHLYKSDKDGHIMDNHFLSMHWPYHWHYDILRVLEYFAFSDSPYDKRMKDALDWLESKKKNGVWSLSPRYAGQYFFTMEKVSQNSKINTIRATYVLDKFFPNR